MVVGAALANPQPSIAFLCSLLARSLSLSHTQNRHTDDGKNSLPSPFPNPKLRYRIPSGIRKARCLAISHFVPCTPLSSSFPLALPRPRPLPLPLPRFQLFLSLTRLIHYGSMPLYCANTRSPSPSFACPCSSSSSSFPHVTGASRLSLMVNTSALFLQMYARSPSTLSVRGFTTPTP